MTSFLPADPLREGALVVVRTLRAAGHQALFAGGSVRDRVRGLAPKDYDIATDARPDEVMALFERTIPVGVQFGVVRVLIHHHPYEVATFRAEADYVDGRRPTGVAWADAEADVRRRDFTVNGLLEDPLAPGGPEVHDFVGGLDDLRDGLLRAIGEPRERFLEDHLRLLRGVRFATRLGFAIEARTWEAMRELAGRVTRVSPERIHEELERMWTQGSQARSLELLERSGLLAEVLPEVAPASVGHDAFAATERRLAHLGPCDPALGWGAVLLGLPVAAIALRLRWSKQRARDVAEVIATAPEVARWADLAVADRKRAARRDTFGAALTVAGADGHLAMEARARAEAAAWTAAELRPPPLLTGDDLAAAGHRPGPRFRDALVALETAQLEGLASKAEAWALVRGVLSP